MDKFYGSKRVWETLLGNTLKGIQCLHISGPRSRSPIVN